MNTLKAFSALTKGAEKVISMSVVNALMGNEGWKFTLGEGGVSDPVHSCEHLSQILVS